MTTVITSERGPAAAEWPVVGRRGKAGPNAVPREVSTHRDQRESGEKYYRDRKENQDSGVRVLRLSGDMHRKQEEPRAARDRNQRRAENAEPVARQDRRISRRAAPLSVSLSAIARAPRVQISDQIGHLFSRKMGPCKAFLTHPVQH